MTLFQWKCKIVSLTGSECPLFEAHVSQVRVQIEDTGTGIKDLDAAFTLGCRDAPDSPLNEHGFGLKHALASANPDNNGWSICTRTKKDLNNKKYVKISSPYRFEKFEAEEIDASSSPWEGKFNSTGTLVTFICSKELYKTLARGVRGAWKNFKSIATLLYEDLGFVYADIIKDARAIIYLKVIPIQGQPEQKSVGALEPDWIETISPGIGTERYDLGNGEVDIDYHFGRISAKADAQDDFDNSKSRKYYKSSMSTSGVEIRINGRLICYNIFKEIWNKEKHNAYNSFLVIINLKSKNHNFLPKTRTSKNGLREGDPHLEKLYQWILGKVIEPPKDSQLAQHEKELFDILHDNIKQYIGDENAVVEREHHTFATAGNDVDKIRIDLFQNANGKITIYEGKKDKTTIKDVYQLRMYWDGLVFDELDPYQGLLVAVEHPQTVQDMVKIVNTMKDAKGRQYNLKCTTWMELGIQHSGKKQ